MENPALPRQLFPLISPPFIFLILKTKSWKFQLKTTEANFSSHNLKLKFHLNKTFQHLFHLFLNHTAHAATIMPKFTTIQPNKATKLYLFCIPKLSKLLSKIIYSKIAIIYSEIHNLQLFVINLLNWTAAVFVWFNLFKEIGWGGFESDVEGTVHAFVCFCMNFS